MVIASSSAKKPAEAVRQRHRLTAADGEITVTTRKAASGRVRHLRILKEGRWISISRLASRFPHRAADNYTGSELANRLMRLRSKEYRTSAVRVRGSQ